MLGAQIGKLAGERRVLQASVVVHGGAMGLMASSTNTNTMNLAQASAGIAAATAVPTLVVLIAANHDGRQLGNRTRRAGGHSRGRQRLPLRHRGLPRHRVELALLILADRFPRVHQRGAV